jgi:CRP/FNR family cyclic AMP-dependent transcriptional regulator
MRYGRTRQSLWCDAGVRSLLPPELWESLVSRGLRRVYRTGDRLMSEGETDTRVVVLTEGRVKVTCNEEDGTEVLLAIRCAGDVLGERAAIDHGVRSATVTALRPCTARVLTADEFMQFVSEHNLGMALLRLAIARQREGQQIRVELSTLPAERRLARTLLRLADTMDGEPGGSVTLDLALPQEELARAIGASRSQVAAHLGRLRELGIVSTGRRRLVVHDLARLRAVADGRRSRRQGTLP